LAAHSIGKFASSGDRYRGLPRGRHAIPRLREKILTSALELFAQNSFEKVTGDQLAAGARVGKGSVYRQFGSKEGLYAAAILVGFRQLRLQLERVIEEEHSFPERIATIVRHVMSCVWDRGDFFVLIPDPGTILPAAAARHYRRECRELSLLIGEVLKGGAAAGWIRSDLNFQLVAESVLGMIGGVPRYRRKEVTVEAAARTIIAILLGGCLSSNRQIAYDAGFASSGRELYAEPSARAPLTPGAPRARQNSTRKRSHGTKS
jgi:AcrR family transcriptional regulator